MIYPQSSLVDPGQFFLAVSIIDHIPVTSVLLSGYVCVWVCVCVCVSHPVISDSLWPHRLWPTRLLYPWNSPGKNTGVGCHSLFYGFFLTQASNPCFLHCRQILYHLRHREWIALFITNLFEKWWCVFNPSGRILVYQLFPLKSCR